MRSLIIPRVRNSVAGSARPLQDITLTWSATRPHEIAMTVSAHGVLGGPGIRWVIGRDLLAAGIDHPVGLGDVALLPDLATADQRDREDRHVEMVLSVDGRSCALKIPVEPLRILIDYTYSVVHAGDEGAQLHWDISELTGGAV